MSNKFDLIIIGAGINGAGVAKLASESGLDVLLLEQYDKPAMGTSSKSSKLIHGGLRYLESGELRFVYKSLRERRNLLKYYPDLVKLKPFFIPLYQDSKRSTLLVHSGLFIYWALNFFRKSNSFKKIPKSKYSKLDGLKTKDLKAVFQYYDAQTDDKKLTYKVLQEAIDVGAKVKFLHKIKSIKLANELSTVSCENDFVAQANFIVNAAGPWVNKILDKVADQTEKLAVDLVQGTHIVIKGKLIHGLYYVEAHDGRAVFIMPWHDNILVGTTEKLHTDKPEQAKASNEEVAYLLQVFNTYFPQTKVDNTDIIEKMAGLRVLPRADSAVFSRSREVKILVDRKLKPRLVSIYGGKLTSWHSTAKEVLQKLA